MKKTIAEYDAVSDSLAIQVASKKSSFSIENGEVVIDFDAKKEVVGIEFMNASKLLSLIAQKEVSKDSLKAMKNCKLVMSKTKNTVVIGFTLAFANEPSIENSITVPLLSEKQVVAMERS